MVLLRSLLGDVLRRHRQQQARTLREVSAEARISMGYLSEVERGVKEASSELLAAICDALEVPLADVLREVGDEMAGTDQVLLVDDFHYMPRDVQAEVAKQLKEAARRDVHIITAAVPHRADDVVRATPELRGRVTAVDVPYWETADLVRIAERLKIRVTHSRRTGGN